MDVIIIVDFGSQYTHLITKVLRNFNTYSIVTQTIPSKISKNVKGIILSGGPNSVSNISYNLNV